MPADRTPAGGGPEVRWLPPGQMKEHYEQYVYEIGQEHAVTFPFFWKVPGLKGKGVYV